MKKYKKLIPLVDVLKLGDQYFDGEKYSEIPDVWIGQVLAPWRKESRRPIVEAQKTPRKKASKVSVTQGSHNSAMDAIADILEYYITNAPPSEQQWMASKLDFVRQQHQ